jgi:hypothetical protein
MNRKKNFVLSVVPALTACLSVVTATPFLLQATPSIAATLDQENPLITSPSGFTALSVANNFTQAQTFTSGLTGTLSRVTVGINRNFNTTEDITLSILTTDSAGAPGSLLTSTSLTPANIDTEISLVSFDVSGANLILEVGDILAIQLTSPAANDFPFEERYQWQLGASYARGQSFTNGSGRLRSEDFVFQTFVTTVPESIPESSFTLSILALGTLGVISTLNRKLKPSQSIRKS